MTKRYEVTRVGSHYEDLNINSDCDTPASHVAEAVQSLASDGCPRWVTIASRRQHLADTLKAARKLGWGFRRV